MTHLAVKSADWLAVKAEELGVLPIANVVLTNPKFTIWPGSSKPFQHHYRVGGLAEHTREVVELCLTNSEYFANKNVDKCLLYCAALFHDAGKMWDYEPMPIAEQIVLQKEEFPEEYKHWKGTNHKRKIHHISRSGLVWHKAASLKIPCRSWETLSEKEIDEVLHAILSHHGLREWGSPVAPNSHIAWLLHLCDGISARMDDCDKWDLIK